MSAAYNGGDTSTNAGNDNSPFPGYLRNNYANDLQNGASMTICHGMVQSKIIVPKCLVGKYLSEESEHRVYGKHCSYRHSDFY